MAKDYSWFKFKLPDWMMGRIQKQKPEVRGVFLNLACKYWQKQCVLSIEDAKEELEEVDYAYDSLLKKQIIKEHDGNVVISFLDEQWAENEALLEHKRNGGKASAAKRVTPVQQNPTGVEQTATAVEHKSTDVQQDSTAVQFCSTIKNEIREEEIRIDEKRVEENEKDNTPEGVVGLAAPTPTDKHPSLSDRGKKFIDKFNELRQSKFQFTEEVKGKLSARLKKYEPQQIIDALKIAIADKYHIENNFQYLTPEYILREKILERYLNTKPQNKSGNVHQTAIQPANRGFRVQSGK